MFPIWDDQVKWWYIPVFTWAIIAINVGIFLFQNSLSEAWLEAFFQQYAVIPSMIMSGENLTSLITSMFLHGWWMHLIGNMLFLRVFGDNIEARIGNMKFLMFYLLTGIVASFSHILTDTASMIPSLGASGAISAVLGAYLVLFPWSRVKVLDIRFWQTYFVPAVQFLGYWILIQLVTWFGSLAAASGWGGVAYFAHIWWFAAWWIWAQIGHMLPKDYNQKWWEVVERAE